MAARADWEFSEPRAKMAHGCLLEGFETEKALAAVDRGVPCSEAVGMFGVYLAMLKRWLKKRSEGPSPLLLSPKN
jgi:hypothetical protein